MKLAKTTTSDLGLEVRGLDAKALTPQGAAELRALVYEQKLVILKDQDLSRSEYVAFGRVMGRPQVYFQDHYHHPEHPEIFVSSNMPENGRKVGVAATGRFWHSDYQFFDEPLSITTISPQILPNAVRETWFVDMERAYAELPQALKAIADKHWALNEATWYYKVQPFDMDRALMDLVREFREISPGALHPLAIEHPTRGYRALYASEGFTTAVFGLEQPESRDFLAELFRHLDQSERVERIRWQRGDLLLWDNRGLIHRGGPVPEGEPTVSYRVGVYDELPFYRDPGPRPDVSRLLSPSNPWSVER